MPSDALSYLPTLLINALSSALSYLPPRSTLRPLPIISLPALSRRTTAFNLYVSNTGSVDIPPSWALALYNPAYTGAGGPWNMQVRQ